MKTETQLSTKITGEIDSATISLSSSGNIMVGSIILKPDEVSEFCVALRDVVEKLQAQRKENA